jgi:hypothetical protein
MTQTILYIFGGVAYLFGLFVLFAFWKLIQLMTYTLPLRLKSKVEQKKELKKSAALQKKLSEEIRTKSAPAEPKKIRVDIKTEPQYRIGANHPNYIELVEDPKGAMLYVVKNGKVSAFDAPAVMKLLS